jgi:uncharacterized OB-fold protein
MSVPRYWREIPSRYRLEAGKCNNCGKIFFPARLICNNCKGREFTTINLSPEGEIVTYTIIHVAPKDFSIQTPYAVGIIELKEKVRILAQIVDCNLDELEIGKKVKVVFRKIMEYGESGIKCYGYKCVPI